MTGNGAPNEAGERKTAKDRALRKVNRIKSILMAWDDLDVAEFLLNGNFENHPSIR